MLVRLQNKLRSRRLWCWVTGVLAVYTLTGFVAMPWVVERQLAVLLQERLGVQTVVEDIRLNPWALTFAIDGLDLIDADGRRLMSLESGFVNLQINSLTQRAWSIQELYLSGLHGSVRRYATSDSNIARLASRWSACAAPAPEAAPSAELATLPRLLIADLRVEDASLAFTDDVQSPPFFTSVDDLDFFVENLSTLPDASAPEALSLTMGNGSQLTLTGSLSLNPLRSEGELTLSGPYVELAYSYLRYQLPVRLTGGWLEAGFQYQVAMPPQGEVEAAVSGFNATLSDLLVSHPANGTRLASVPLLAVEGGALQLAERSASVERVRLDGVDLRPERAADGTINFLSLLPPAGDAVANAASTAEAAATGAPSTPWQVHAAQLALQGWTIGLIDRVPAEPVAVDLSIEATLDGLNNVPQTPITVAALLDLSSGGSLRAGGTLNVLPQVDFNGEVVLDGLALPLVQPYVAPFANISLDSRLFAVAGDLAASPGAVRFTGSLTLDDFAATDAVERESLLGLRGVAIESLVVEAGERLQIDIGDIHIREPYVRVEIEQDGANNFARKLIPRASVDSAQTLITSNAAVSSGLPSITVQNIQFENGSADFSDESLPLPFAVDMASLGGAVSSLSTRTSEPARLQLEGQVDEYGLVAIGGQLRPFAPAELTEIDLRFRNLDIPTMSPYVIKFAGRRIDDGDLDVDLDVDLSYRINEGQLSGDNALVMRDMVLGERVTHPDAMDLPLGLAVALLKDANGVINREVPVRGDLNNLQFDYGRVIRSAIADTIASIVTSPFRLLASLVGSGDEELEAINFMPGRADVAPPERETLVSLAGALAQRPQLLLKINGVFAATEDTESLREQFLDQRLEEALAAGANSHAGATTTPTVPAVSRTSILEGLYMSAQQSVDLGATATAVLQQLRVQSTVAATRDAPEQFWSN